MVGATGPVDIVFDPHVSQAIGWLLMALIFAAGIMSLLWMAAIAAFVLIEKLFPAGQWIARAGGLAMLGLALYLLFQH